MGYKGCKINENHKETIVDIARKKNIAVYQFVESNDGYKLIPKLIRF